MLRLSIVFLLILSSVANGQRYQPQNLVGRFDGTTRKRHFAAYVIGGAYYSIDMATNKDVESGVPGIKLQQRNVCETIGRGTDFYMAYFKFGLELRYNFGLINVHIPDNNNFSNPIDKIFARSWLLSFTFEG